VREYWKVKRGKFKKRRNACYQDLTVSHPQDRLRFTYINVGGLQRKIRNGDIRSWLTETDADVVVLVETQHLSCDLELGGWKGVNWSHREWRRRKTKVHSACVDKEIRSGGVCILVKSDRWGELRPEFELVGPSIARVAIHSSGRKLHVFGVYLPGGWSNHKKDDTKEILSDSLCSVPLGEPRVVLGDLNFHTASLCPEGLEWNRE